jgi:hypothetical protein
LIGSGERFCHSDPEQGIQTSPQTMPFYRH